MPSKLFANTNWLDWVVSILLVIAIVAIAMWVCNDPNRDSTDEEGFWSKCGGSHDEDEEKFTNPASAPPVKNVTDLKNLDDVGDGDIGCCLVYYKNCGHCQTYKPKWADICNKVNGKTIAGKRIKMCQCGDDINQNAWRQVSSRFGIKGYPTIMVKIGGSNADWTEYTGSREALGSYLEQVQ